MFFADKHPNFESTYCALMPVLHSVLINRFLIVKALVGTFNKEKALVGAFSGHCEIFAGLHWQLYSYLAW